MTSPTFELETRGSDETREAGRRLADWLEAGDVVLLHGDLGSGKTTLAQGVAAGLGVESPISSPSFVLINEYDVSTAKVPGRLFHVDLYRLRDQADLESIGYAEIIAPIESVTLVEWPERAQDLLPDDYLLIEIKFTGSDQRDLRFSFRSSTATAADRLAQLQSSLLSSP
jgi:tRNA threonylcarbamoyladenosine biosynthesis protein TsaE